MLLSISLGGLASPSAYPAGELPASTVNIVAWEVPSAFAVTDRMLQGRVRLVPAVEAGSLQLTLCLNGAPVAGAQAFYGTRPPVWSSDQTRWVNFAFLLPGDLPDGPYTIEAVAGPRVSVAGETSQPITGGSVPAPQPARRLEVKGAGSKWLVRLSQPLAHEAVLGVWLLQGADDEILQAAACYRLAQGQRSLEVELPRDGRWAAAGGTLLFQVGAENIDPARLAAGPVTADVEQGSPAEKPMAHGIYRERSGAWHYWWVDDQHALWWDGERWIPEGGMFYLFPSEGTLEARQRQWAEITACLDKMQAAGFNDLYVNGGVGLTQTWWDVQRVVNEFNRRGVRFGWQLTTGAKPFSAYSIRSSEAQGLIKGACEQAGTLRVELPRVPLKALLLVPVQGGERARRVEYAWEGKNAKAGMEIAQILESENNVGTATVNVPVPGLKRGEYYVIVEAVEDGKRVSNVWERLEETKQGLDWVRLIDWGSGLRFFVDPICNEGGINNRYEVVRVASPAFEREFARLLREKYEGSLERLARAWHVPAGELSDFEQAARLIPLRDQDSPAIRDSLLLIDPQTGEVLRTESGPGASWMDYLELVRVSYADKRDEIARYLKEKVTVPVVYKRVSPWTSVEGVSRALDGFDGVGLELYPEEGSTLPSGALSGRLEADLAPHTVWLIVTELGYSAKPGNLGVKSWPSEDHLRKVLREAFGAGAKGVFLFGWRLPSQHWENHSLLNQPDRLEWVRAAFDELVDDPASALSVLGQVFPEGQSWWWKAGGVPWTRYNSVYAGPPSAFPQSLFLAENADGGQLWAISTSQPVPGLEPVVVNLADAFYADHYGAELSRLHAEGNRMIYLGLWPEPAQEPAVLRRHFKSTQPLPLPGGGLCQPLEVFPGDEVLARDEHGNVWAKLTDGDQLLIVSATPVAPAVKNAAEASPVLQPEWVDSLMWEGWEQ
jgi:hypothetical protein